FKTCNCNSCNYNISNEEQHQAPGLHQPEVAPAQSYRDAALRPLFCGGGLEDHAIFPALPRRKTGADTAGGSGKAHADGRLDIDAQSSAAGSNGLADDWRWSRRTQ